MRDIWTKLPFTTEFHVYVLNVTNPEEIDAGGKPIVHEIGPFVYDVHQEKIKQIDHEEDDTVSYVPNNLYYFNKYKSEGLSDDTEICYPHLFIMTVSNGPMKEKPQLLSWTMDTILNRPQSAFYKVKVGTALFEGFEIPCAGVEDYFGKALCNEMRENYFEYTLRRKNDTFYASLFGYVSWTERGAERKRIERARALQLSGTYDKERRIRIKRGASNLEQLGRPVEVDGRDNLATRGDDECDAFRGTDSSIFPPFPRRERGVPVVLPTLCRKLTLAFLTPAPSSDGEHVPADRCYCVDPAACLRRGALDLYRCIRVPFVASGPHFYLADPRYSASVADAAFAPAERPAAARPRQVAGQRRAAAHPQIKPP
ncbi:sensory neuron membrane protein 1-like [Phymastichus coffea]|uniref:sensory neuron membrane protein 1-like n=1 Tax=Phymastichus coffea TaxID=108790 RepID=UPI00273C6BA3|nr:sensory neuron membrane protein 1-like [Phymastichus coffea]